MGEGRGRNVGREGETQGWKGREDGVCLEGGLEDVGGNDTLEGKGRGGERENYTKV